MAKLSDTLRQRVAETHSEILTLDARLVALPAEKEAVLAAAQVDTKALIKLEDEERLSAQTVPALRQRLELLASQIEGALKAEAIERQISLKEEWEEVAHAATEAAGEVRQALEQVMGLVESAHTAWGRYETAAAENWWLSLRFKLPQINHPMMNRFTTNEIEAFAFRVKQILQKTSTEAGVWARQAEDWQHKQRTDQHAEPPRPMVVTNSGPLLSEFLERQQQYKREHPGSSTPRVLSTSQRK